MANTIFRCFFFTKKDYQDFPRFCGSFWTTISILPALFDIKWKSNTEACKGLRPKCYVKCLPLNSILREDVYSGGGKEVVVKGGPS